MPLIVSYEDHWAVDLRLALAFFVAAVALAIAILVVLFVPNLHVPADQAEWQTTGVIVQAFASVTSVIVAMVLALTAWIATRISRDQVSAARDVVDEMQRDRAWSAMPMLSLWPDVVSRDAAGRVTVPIRITNVGSAPALQVEVVLREAADLGRKPKGDDATILPTSPLLGAGQVVQPIAGLHRFAPGAGTRMLRTDWVLIEATYAGPLGSRLTQQWYWEPNDWAGSEEPVAGHGDKLILWSLEGRSRTGSEDVRFHRRSSSRSAAGLQ